MKKMFFAILGLVMVAGCAGGISDNNVSDNPTPLIRLKEKLEA